jgi:hypothetical protein
MSANHRIVARRSYGSGSIVVRRDRNGRETFYGRWWADGRRVKRRLGVKREAGSGEGLTVAQAEAELRRRMAQEGTQGPLTARLTVVEVGERYIGEARRKGRKSSTVANLDSELRIHIVAGGACREPGPSGSALGSAASAGRASGICRAWPAGSF